MRLRCEDGKTRAFSPSGFHDDFNRWYESTCAECGKQFGVHDTKILKPIWRSIFAEKVIVQHKPPSKPNRKPLLMLKATWHGNAPTRIYCADMDYVELEFEGRKYRIEEVED